MKIAVLGGGQLGQMLALAGYPLGIKVSCFDQSAEAPAGAGGNLVVGELNDSETLHDWVRAHDILTYEFENFPVELVADLAEIKPAYPGPGPLAIAQDRWGEKRLFDEAEIPIPPFRTVTNKAELDMALKELGLPVVAKTRTGGYDGKGQAVMREPKDLRAVEALLENSELIVEELVPFEKEVSIIGVRSASGEITMYPLTENEHRSGILHASLVPARVTPEIEQLARKHMEDLLIRLRYVGVLALELFVSKGRLLANEIAPRVHNSGHWTIEGAETSQFENHLRAVANLPLGSTELRTPTAMLNLIGTVPPLAAMLEIDGAHVHLYGKEPRPGRKLGHVTLTGPTPDVVRQRLNAVEAVMASFR